MSIWNLAKTSRQDVDVITQIYAFSPYVTLLDLDLSFLRLFG